MSSEMVWSYRYPEQGNSEFELQEQALPPLVESGQGRRMSLGRRTVGGAIVFVSSALLWAFNAFGFVVDVVSAPEDAGTLRGATIAALRKFAEIPDWGVYLFLAAILLIGLAMLFGWHPEKGWRFPRQRAAPTLAPTEDEYADTAHIPLLEAGLWLYSNASGRLQQHLRSMVPDPFETIAAHAAAYFTTQWQEGRCDLYGRWEPGLPMEKIDPKDGDFTAFSAVFGSDKRPILDQSVLGRDLRPVLEFYEDAVAALVRPVAEQWFTPAEARAKFLPAEQAKIDAALAAWKPLSESAEEARLAFAEAPEDDGARELFQERSTQASIAYNKVEAARYTASLELLVLLRSGDLIAKGVERVNGRAEDEKLIKTVYWNFFVMNLEEATAGGQGHTYLAVRIREA